MRVRGYPLPLPRRGWQQHGQLVPEQPPRMAVQGKPPEPQPKRLETTKPESKPEQPGDKNNDEGDLRVVG